MRFLSFLLLAVFLALSTSAIQRRGPDQGVYCAIRKINGVEVYCPKPKLNGGWPAPYLFDREGVSVEWHLGFFEDDFRTWPFVADVSFYLLLMLGVRFALQSLRNRLMD